MCKRFVQLPLILVWVTCLVSCSSANNKPLSIRFSADSSSVVFRDIDPAGLLQVKNTPGIDTAYSTVISVVQEPSDNDSTSMEHSFPGKIQVTDSMIVFKPSTPFVRGRSYLLTSYLNAKFGNASMMLRGKMSHAVKPEQVVLKR